MTNVRVGVAAVVVGRFFKWKSSRYAHIVRSRPVS